MIKGRPLVSEQLDLLDFSFYIDKLIHLNSRPQTPTSASSVTTVNREVDPNALSVVENLVVQYALNRIIEELNIINNGCSKRFSEMGKNIWGGRAPFKQRLEMGELHENIFYSPTIQKMKEGLVSVFYIKMSRDISWCVNVLESTASELQLTGCYESLKKTVAIDRENEIEEFKLIKDYIKNKHYIEYLEKKMTDYRLNADILLESLDVHIQKLENKIHDTRLQSAIKTRLVQKWESARFQQGTLMMYKIETNLNSRLDDVNQRLDIESRAINEIENFIKYEIERIEEQTEYWRMRYDTEIEKLDDAIQMATEYITDLQRKHDEMKELYETRAAEIDDYWTQKKLAAEAIALAEKKWKCAIKIQAWWRGTMVRRHLGPYRKKKKGKGGKGGKGKKK